MTDHTIEMENIDKTSGSVNTTPAMTKEVDDEKKMTLIDIISESVPDVEKGLTVQPAETVKNPVKKKKGTKLYISAREAAGLKDEPKYEVCPLVRSTRYNAEEEEKKPSFLGKVCSFLKKQLYTKPVAFWGRSKNAVIVAMAVTIVCLVAAVITLSVVTVDGSKNTAALSKKLSAAQQSLAPHQGLNVNRREVDTDLSYAASVTDADTCDDETSVLSSVATMSGLISNVTAVMAPSVDVLTLSRPTVTAFLPSSSLVTDITMSTSTSTAQSSTTIETCGEWGDGAGPCARPYGRPNPTPEAWISALAAESQGKASNGIPAGTSSTFFPIGVPVPGPSSSVTTDASPQFSTLSSVSALDASECAPTATVFITVTAASEPANMTALGDATIYETSTSVVNAQLVTVTWSGSNGPMTTTETVYNGNGTSLPADETVIVSAINGTGALTTATLEIPSYTLTLSSPLSTATPSGGVTPVVSGGDKVAVPKPLGMGGSKSGNGVYCVVMLVALAALLI